MNNPNISIRPYDAATDIKILSAIWLDASRHAHAFIGEERLLDQQKLVEEIYLPKAETTVACLGGEPAGFISLLGNFIGGLFVAPMHQGRGIGRRLVAHALEEKGELSLEVYLDNAQAVGFYKRLGFRELSRRPVDDQGLPFANALMHLAKD